MSQSLLYGEHANNSLYSAMHLFSGFMFGAAEYSLLMVHALRIDVFVLILLALAPLLYLWAHKGRLDDRHERTFALRRPYLHIAADFLLAISTISTFSIFVFTITRALPLLDQNLTLPLHSFFLSMNLILFFLAIVLFRLFAHRERKLIRDAS